MKKTLLLLSLSFFLSNVALITAQQMPDVTERMIMENISKDNGPSQKAGGDLCPADPCPCSGGLTEVKLYYFGVDDTQISIFANPNLTGLIASFANVDGGQQLTLSGASQPGGRLPVNVYIRQTEPGGRVCVTKLYTFCPIDAWPGALEDLKIVGKTFGDFTVYSVKDLGNSFDCDLSNVQQDWHVGGNVVAPVNNTLGTRNNEDVLLISNDDVRGAITKTGNFGLGTAAPSERLEVSGNTRLNGTLDVSGIARMNNSANSTAAGNGALIVAGGAGVGKDLNVGEDLATVGTASVGSADNSTSASTGALTVVGGAGIGKDLHVGDDLTVVDAASVGSTLTAISTSTGALTVAGGAGIAKDVFIGDNLDVADNAHIGGRLTVGTTNTPGTIDIVNTSNYSLFVSDGILTEEVLVNSGWADHVFSPDYRLKSLEEVADYIRQNGRLPDTPSASEIEKGGLELGACAVNQQVKIEELFLYMIQIQEEMRRLKSENENLKNRIDVLTRK